MNEQLNLSKLMLKNELLRTYSPLTLPYNIINPHCEHFNICGGCSLQILSPHDQLKLKKEFVLKQLQQHEIPHPTTLLPPITAKKWYYRHKARLSVRYDRKKDRVLVGFREKANSRFVADIQTCHTLHPKIGLLLMPFRTLIAALSIKDQIPQLEVAIGENATIIIRHTQPFTDDDIMKLQTFANDNAIYIYLQSGNEDTIKPLNKSVNSLYYSLPNHDIKINFTPAQFTQINFTINRSMIAKVIDLLNIESNDIVLDLFSGVGNFTLPIAKYAKKVIGVELSQKAVEQAKQNALQNNLYNAIFYAEDLSAKLDFSFLKHKFNKVLLDPSRTGANTILKKILPFTPEMIIYISCNPKSLAEDAKLLTYNKLYQYHSLAIIDMFPQTSHIETVSVFIRS